MKGLDANQQRAVLDGAMQLFEKHHLRDITLDMLTKQTGVASFDIVRHYHSSENILKCVLERELELMAAAAQSPELRMPGETLNDELRLKWEDCSTARSSFRADCCLWNFSKCARNVAS